MEQIYSEMIFQLMNSILRQLLECILDILSVMKVIYLIFNSEFIHVICSLSLNSNFRLTLHLWE